MDLMTNIGSSREQTKYERCFQSFRENIVNHWRGYTSLLIPVCSLPILLIDLQSTKYRCMYCITLMIGYWITEVIPPPITALLPVVLFPLLMIADAHLLTPNYFSESAVRFVASCMTSLSFQYCGLHKRIALTILSIVGCRPRAIHAVLMTISFVMSTLLGETIVTSLMCPIVKAILEILRELDIMEIYKMYKSQGESVQRPTIAARGFYFGIAFAVTTGNIVSMIGSTSVKQCILIYNRYFNDPEMELASYLYAAVAVPAGAIIVVTTGIFLQVSYLGLFRSREFHRKIGMRSRKRTFNMKLLFRDIGGLTWNQCMIIVLFVLLAILYFTRYIRPYGGWVYMFASEPNYLLDSAPTVLVVCLFFMLPANLNFLRYFYKNNDPLPQKQVPSLVKWEFLRQHLPWGSVFVIGGALSIETGIESTQLFKSITDNLDKIAGVSKHLIILIIILIVFFCTQFTSSLAMVEIVSKIIADSLKPLKIRPLYLMLPTAMASGACFLLPVSTPTNLIIVGLSKIRIRDFFVAGLFPSFISIIVIYITSIGWVRVIYPGIDLPYDLSYL